ncbi:MAG: glycosyltransferase family 2 protein [Anaerolineae bacterium]|nr:glycosyltransferase family 2 protein [Anaerolineae bacterium]
MASVDMSIVLVCWNNKAYLGPCLESLYGSRLDSSFDVIVVDNGSTDGSLEMLRSEWPEIMIIENGSNVGLSKASNQGIEATSGRYVLLLNNDTLVNKDALDSMVAYLDHHPEAGAVGGKLLNEDGSFQGGYAKFSTLWEELLIVTGLGFQLKPGYPSHFDARQPLPVDWLSSACLLLRRSALDQVGLLDEVYFIYGDEVDLQYRLNKSGWQVVYLPEATTIHFGGRSMNRWKRRKMVYRGKLLFYQKNYGWLAGFALRILFSITSLLKAILWALVYPIRKQRERAGKELQANWDVLKLCAKLQ